MEQGWVGDTCVIDLDCACSRLRCDGGECACYWAWGLVGHTCSELTIWTSGVLISRCLFLALYLPWASWVLNTLWTSWNDAPPWLRASLFSNIIGGALLSADAIVALPTILGAISHNRVRDTIFFNLLSGAGLIVYNLGIIATAIVWIDIARVAKRMVAMQAKLALTYRLVAAYGILLTSLLVILVALTPSMPEAAFRGFSILGLFTGIVGVIGFGMGSRLLAAKLENAAALRSLADDTPFSDVDCSRPPAPSDVEMTPRSATPRSARTGRGTDGSDKSEERWEYRVLRDIRTTSATVSFFICCQFVGIFLFFLGAYFRLVPLYYLGVALAYLIGGGGAATTVVSYVRRTQLARPTRPGLKKAALDKAALISMKGPEAMTSMSLAAGTSEAVLSGLGTSSDELPRGNSPKSRGSSPNSKGILSKLALGHTLAADI